jgi:hypothetical protein
MLANLPGAPGNHLERWPPLSPAALDLLTARTRAENVELVSRPLHTPHATLRRCERGIKTAYVDLCINCGSRSNSDDNSLRYFYSGLNVVTTGEKVVVTAYWADGYHLDADKCIERFDNEIKCRKLRKAKQAKREKDRQAKQEK